MDLKGMGKRIRQKRISQSLTQEQLAEKTNLTVAYIGMIERGERTPSLETFIHIVDELNATADELLCDNFQRGLVIRLAKYEERISALSTEEADKIYTVFDTLLGLT